MKKGICDVCFYVDNDSTIKDVEYCEVCQAYICKKCEPNLFRRGMAMIKKQALKLALLLIVAFPSCKKEEIKKTEQVTSTAQTYTTKPVKREYLIVVEKIKTSLNYSLKINGIDYSTLTTLKAYSGDKLEITDTGSDGYTGSPSGNVIKVEGKIQAYIYINNTLVKEVNCECDLTYIKTLE